MHETSFRWSSAEAAERHTGVGNVRKILIAGSVIVATAVVGAGTAAATDGDDTMVTSHGDTVLAAPDGNDILLLRALV
jgi:hypothetical protein